MRFAISRLIFAYFVSSVGFTSAAIFGHSLLWWKWLHCCPLVWSGTSRADRWVHRQHEKDCGAPEGKKRINTCTVCCVTAFFCSWVNALYTRFALFCVQSLSEKTRVIFLSCPPLNEEMLRTSTSSTILSEIVRTNETCHLYSDACVALCKEMNLKVVDLWHAMQKREDWMTACFTWVVRLINYIYLWLIRWIWRCMHV